MYYPDAQNMFFVVLSEAFLQNIPTAAKRMMAGDTSPAAALAVSSIILLTTKPSITVPSTVMILDTKYDMIVTRKVLPVKVLSFFLLSFRCSFPIEYSISQSPQLLQLGA